MAITTVKLTELPLRNTIPLTCHSPRFLLISFPSGRPCVSLLLKPFSSLRATTKTPGKPPQNPIPTPSKSKPHSTSWLQKWPSPNPPKESNSKTLKTLDSKLNNRPGSPYFDGNSRNGTSSIDRIVLRLRNLGLGSDDEEEEFDEENEINLTMPVTGEEKLGDLLRRDWVRPDTMLVEEEDSTVLPWEREEVEVEVEEREKGIKRRMVKAPTLAELTIEDEELRRLRRQGMTLRERISVPKAGVTGVVLEKIHEKWRKLELVRLKFHETLAHDMKTAHEIVEVGGLTIYDMKFLIRILWHCG
ncbi:unnamed protein product [Ilex paraguariensis]|uniref:CRM domain-containing protein n=1 Tax=Ilex paraguariensis TaxID=185542 RepID=A0ABC8TEH8_9AQUA